MDSPDLQRIRHIKGYCEDIARTIQRFGEAQETFFADNDYRNSIAMSIMQIGELSVGLTEEFKDATKDHMQWGLMRGMRNMFAHTYAKMDKAIVWEVATRDIPTLSRFCDSVLVQATAEIRAAPSAQDRYQDEHHEDFDLTL